MPNLKKGYQHTLLSFSPNHTCNQDFNAKLSTGKSSCRRIGFRHLQVTQRCSCIIHQVIAYKECNYFPQCVEMQNWQNNLCLLILFCITHECFYSRQHACCKYSKTTHELFPRHNGILLYRCLWEKSDYRFIVNTVDYLGTILPYQLTIFLKNKVVVKK